MLVFSRELYDVGLVVRSALSELPSSKPSTVASLMEQLPVQTMLELQTVARGLLEYTVASPNHAAAVAAVVVMLHDRWPNGVTGLMADRDRGHNPLSYALRVELFSQLQRAAEEAPASSSLSGMAELLVELHRLNVVRSDALHESKEP